MTLTRANAMGWGLFELLTSSQMNHIDSQLPNALDAAAGGTYAPVAPIILQQSSGVIPFKLNVGAGASPQRAMEITGTVNGTWLHVQGAPALNTASPVAWAMGTVGHKNAGTSGGGIGFLGQGGMATHASGQGGAGLYGWGGEGQDGSSNGVGGTGVVGEGGIGGSGSVDAVDRGYGLYGFGSVGVFAIAGGTSPFASGFNTDPLAALHAVSSGVGRAVSSEFRGACAENAMNRFAWVGTATLTEVLCRMEAALSSGPSSTVDVSTLLRLSANSTSGRVNCIDARGQEAVGIFADALGTTTFPGLGIVPKSAQLNRFYPGGITNMNVAVVTGLSSNALFCGTDQGADGRYDRLVSSADSAAVWAWAVIDFAGAGPTLGTAYNCSGVAPSAAWEVDVTFNVSAGSGVNLCPTVSSMQIPGTGPVVVCVDVLNATSVRISVFDLAGVSVDLSAIADCSMYLQVQAYPSGTRPANRPTYYSAAYPS